MKTRSIVTADMLQDYLAGRLSAHDHHCVERAMAHDPGAAHRIELLRNTAALLQGVACGAQIPEEWIELLARRARWCAKPSPDQRACDQ